MQEPKANWLGGELSPNEVLLQLRDLAAVLIQVTDTKGSTPRDVGTWMVVTANSIFNTIGGGHLEFQAIAIAREMLAGLAKQEAALPQALTKTFQLGPSLGQCCGGVATLYFHVVAQGDQRKDFFLNTLQPANEPLRRVAIVGGGHVGHAIVQALLPLPFHVQWCDSRQEIFPALSHERLQMESFDDITACVPTLATNCALLIMSFTHAEDLDVLRAALQRNRQSPGSFNWIGLIGSKTKWSRFQNRLMERGISQAELDQVVCPIGLPGISGKSPAVIAASVAAQLLLIPPQVSTASTPG